jgi:hypothetical protein
MLFSYLTDIKLEEEQFLNTNKTIIRHLRDGDFGISATIKNITKTTPSDFLKELEKHPLVCDFTMFKEINYNKIDISHPEGELTPIGGHRMMIISYEPKTGAVFFANTSGINKVQTMDFALFFYSLRKYIKMTINTELKPITPLSQTDKRWKGYRLGKSKITVGSHGCLITSICMAMERLRGYAANPGDASKYWVFSKSGLLQWALTEFQGIEYKGMASYSLDTVKQTSNDKAYIIKVQKKGIPEHFVLVDCVVGDKVMIIDPIGGKIKWLNESGYKILGLRLLESK